MIYKRIKLLTEKQYYDIMCHMDKFKTFEEVHRKWYQCFYYILKEYKCGFNAKSISALFYRWEMDNWKVMYRANTEYKDYTNEQLIKTFRGECHYISDRASFDRLFRTHWLFREGYYEEFNKVTWND